MLGEHFRRHVSVYLFACNDGFEALQYVSGDMEHCHLATLCSVGSVVRQDARSCIHSSPGLA